MFNGCNNLKEIKGLNNLITNKVTDMSWMFYDCKNLISIDISNFKTDNVTDMREMFNGCNNLKEINISNFKLKKECYTSDIFNGINKKECKLLTTDENIKNLFN